MSTLQVANVYLESTGNNRIQYAGSNTMSIYSAGIERMRIDSSGNMGIGTGSPASKLDVFGTVRSTTQSVPSSGSGVELFYNAGTGYVLSYNRTGSVYLPAIIGGSTLDLQTGGTSRISIDASGAVTISNLAGTGSRTVTAGATGILAAASDSRLKQEVPEAPIAGLAEIMQLRPVAYKWLDDIEKRGDDAAVELGFFADEAKNVIPSAAPMGQDGYYGFYDRAVIAALTKAVQEQQAMIEVLQAHIAILESK